MYNNNYRLSYLPLFYRDLEDKVTYMAKDLKNPRAANQLLDKVEKLFWRDCLWQRHLNLIIR